MKSLKQLAIGLLGVVLTVSAAHGQENKYQLQFRGTSVSTNEAGELSRRTITQNTLVSECIADMGLTNKPKLMLIYHENADFNGDVIEVIGSRTGQLFCQKLRLLFPTTISSFDGADVTQIVSVFPADGNDAIGQGYINKKVSANGKGRISGELIYTLPAQGTNALQLCTASFNTSRLVTISD